MKNTKQSRRSKKFSFDPTKQYIKKFRIYPYFLYSRLDKWLKSMSKKGWHIVHCGIFFLWFEKGEPKEKEYFTYGLPTHEGKYDISLRHLFLEKTYGVKKRKSKINANEAKTCQIVEIDLEKIDIENDIEYKELVSERNRLYMQHFIRVSCAIAISILLVIAFSYL